MVRALLTILIFCTSPAFAAAPLNDDEVGRFVSALEAMNNLDERYSDVDFDFGFDQAAMGNPATMETAFDKVISADGQIVIFDTIITAIAANPQALAEMSTIIRNNGFARREDFASVGNRFLIATARLEMNDSDLEQLREMSDLPPEQMAYLPAAMRPLLERMAAFGAALEAVSASDVALARQYKPRLDALGN